MHIIDVKFDNNQGECNIDLDKGLLEIRVSDKNPAYPSGAQINVPLDPIVQKLIDKAPNIFAKWGLKILLGFLNVA